MLNWLMVATLLGVQAEERLVWPVADGFVVGHSEDGAQSSIEEQVPRGETVEQWTRMRTLIIFREPIEPALFATSMADMWRESCPGAKAGDLVTGRHGVDIRIDCPRNPASGKYETMFQRAVATDSRLYVLQVAFRSAPSAKEAAWAEAELDRATLCRVGAPETACR